MTLPERLLALREQAGLSQYELARRLHYTRSAVSMWEQGRSDPSVSALVMLADLYGVSLDWLIAGRPGRRLRARGE